MNYPYKAFPRLEPDPVTKLNDAWKPVLQVLIWYNHKRSGLLESIVDTGADHTIFDAQIGDDLGIPIRKGREVPFTGVAMGTRTVGYLHKVTLTVAAQTYEAPIIFAYDISATGILGQIGFFDHFIVTFDWTPDPPCFDVQRIPRN